MKAASRAVPRYQALKMALLALIDGGEYGPGDRIPPEPEIAERYGVSRMTANKAILALVAEGRLTRHKGRGTFVSEVFSCHKRPIVVVDRLAEEMEDDYFQGLFWALQRELAEKGVALQAAGMAASGRAGQFAGLGADPLVLIGPSKVVLDDMLAAAARGTKIVVLGASWQGLGITAVDSDNTLGSALAVNHLADLGHREISFLGAFPDDSNTVDRYRGFKAALAARGLPYRKSRTVIANDYLDRDADARRAVEAVLSPGRRPTAVVAAGGQLAMELVGIARSVGLWVPDDLSVVGYDDPPFASRSSPPLTTVRQPLARMASVAAEIIVAGSSTPAYQAFDPILIVRGSSARLK